MLDKLLKNTPVCDCPNSHVEVESSLIRLREATSIINQATDDANTKARLEQTWILQDRLAFPGRLEETDDGRVFECDHQLYELILTACTACEESEWRGHLASSAKDEDESAVDAYTTLAFDIKGFGSVFGKPGKHAVNHTLSPY
ncbi:hypothetical protein MY10362_003266 [Beauveria mimosiformis]